MMIPPAPPPTYLAEPLTIPTVFSLEEPVVAGGRVQANLALHGVGSLLTATPCGVLLDVMTGERVRVLPFFCAPFLRSLN